MKNGSAPNLIVGAGFTGIGCGLASGFQVFEGQEVPGGICASYRKDGFRFEIGGGHWIFGGDPLVLDLMETVTSCRRYGRQSAVFFAGNLPETKALKYAFAPYPIQNNLRALGESFAASVVKELADPGRPKPETIRTMEQWLFASFGEQLCRAFFVPFHEKYTAGLYRTIAPQDGYKSPLNLRQVIDGAFGDQTGQAGYNTTYLYPAEGLDTLAKRLASRCHVDYGVKVDRIDPPAHGVVLSDGRQLEYGTLVSTMPLNKTLAACGWPVGEAPYTSVLVLNIGAELGSKAQARHGNHWVYIPDSLTGFHRVGYYSNVDSAFLPEKLRQADRYGSLYIEFAFAGGQRPGPERVRALVDGTVEELKDWGFIKKALVVDPTWIEVAYTWSLPGSRWVADGTAALAKQGILSSGRYGAWKFQGIAESLRDGIQIGSLLKTRADMGAPPASTRDPQRAASRRTRGGRK